jgi:hypothetical protein
MRKGNPAMDGSAEQHTLRQSANKQQPKAMSNEQ